MADARTTTDHDEIRTWVEARGGRPALDRLGERGSTPQVRFPQAGEARLEDVSWDRFFAAFEDGRLAFLYQEEIAGGEPNRHYEFVARS